MDIICPLCRKAMSVPPERVPEGGSFRLACHTCGTQISVALPKDWKDKLRAGISAAPAPVPSSGAANAAPSANAAAKPAAPAGTAPAAGPKPSVPLKGDGKYVLLADDTLFFRTMMADLLGSNGIRVKVAEDGIMAMQMFEANPDGFALILLDLQMPRLSGFGVLEALKKREKPHPPVIVMTGVHDSHDDIQIVRSLGATGFLDKSMEPSVLMERIVRALEKPKSP